MTINTKRVIVKGKDNSDKEIPKYTAPTVLEKDDTKDDKEKLDILSTEFRAMRNELKEAEKDRDEALSALQIITEKLNVLQSKYAEIQLAEKDPIKYIKDVFCPNNSLVFRDDEKKLKLFRHMNNQAGNWLTLDDYYTMKNKVNENPTYFFKQKNASKRDVKKTSPKK